MKDELLECVRKLMKETARNDAQSEVMAQVAQVLVELADSSPSAVAPRLTKEARRALEKAARAGVESVRMDWDIDGSAMVSIAGDEPFRLQPKLATLLAIIAAPGVAAAADGLIGWRSYREVAALLEKRGGRPVTTDNVSKTIHRLRTVLYDEGQNYFLVQIDRHGSVRFALRTTSEPSRPGIDAHDLHGVARSSSGHP
jgi:hypothetical protein